jgi:hypothetical protein
LGDLPLIGRAFRNETLNGNSNELIISVTPHIVTPGQPMVYPGPPLPSVPTPQPLPTLPPGTLFPLAAPTPMGMASPLTVASPITPPPTRMPRGAASPLPLRTPTNQQASPSPAGPPNTFTYGAPPSVNSAGIADPPKIFYVTFTPNVLSYGEAFQLTTLTTTNVSQLSLSYNGVSLSIPQLGPGQWQATLPFTLIGNPPPLGTIALTLTAAKPDGTQASIAIPVMIPK